MVVVLLSVTGCERIKEENKQAAEQNSHSNGNTLDQLNIDASQKLQNGKPTSLRTLASPKLELDMTMETVEDTPSFKLESRFSDFRKNFNQGLHNKIKHEQNTATRLTTSSEPTTTIAESKS